MEESFEALWADREWHITEPTDKEFAKLWFNKGKACAGELSGSGACCIWSEDEYDSHDYSTGCGEWFNLDDNTLAENGMKFCCFCGKPIEEHLCSDTEE